MTRHRWTLSPRGPISPRATTIDVGREAEKLRDAAEELLRESSAAIPLQPKAPKPPEPAQDSPPSD